MSSAAQSNDARAMLRVRLEAEDRDRMKVIAAKSRLTTQQILTEALNEWLHRRGHTPLTEQK